MDIHKHKFKLFEWLITEPVAGTMLQVNWGCRPVLDSCTLVSLAASFG